MKRLAIAVAVLRCAGWVECDRAAFALGAMNDVRHYAPALAQPAQFQFNFSNDDDDVFSNNRHYDWDQYRNSTSRKERIRDYYRMQNDMQKDYWRHQKDMQKNMIKRQRGW